MKLSPLIRFLLIGLLVGTVAPFGLSLCLFGTTLQTFVLGGPPPQGFWSGAPTPEPTPVPNPVQVWTRQTLSSSGGAYFVLWSILGAFAGEAAALRLRGDDGRRGRRAALGAIGGSAIFMLVTLLGFLP